MHFYRSLKVLKFSFISLSLESPEEGTICLSEVTVIDSIIAIIVPVPVLLYLYHQPGLALLLLAPLLR